ncbi:DUF6518 family protein [Aeromicrobium duanguangcaii]|uniref:DUF6518 family protein n=1 Tax=Aeromicrobium duanguangcaii TaxID=2968086 RepID=UPI0020183AA1|nr:DUF6518 family protein [Aeromicrobium duanguangcaii]MCL3838490.1 DUF6518 family protein [Aeromicrobium duanguangcaii]
MPNSARPFVLWALAGAASGVLAKWADIHGTGWLAVVASELPVWIAATVLIGWFAASVPRAARDAAAFFVAMTAAHYVWALEVAHHPIDRDSMLWFVIALAPCPALAAVVRAARGRRWSEPAVLGASAALICVTGSLPWWWAQVTTSGRDPFAPDHRLDALIDVALALGLVALARTPRRAAAALATAVVLFWPVDQLWDLVATRLPIL